jgi:polysaccharide biosynthesis/export protein
MSRKIGCYLSSNTGVSQRLARLLSGLGLGVVLSLLLMTATMARADAGPERIAPGDTIDVQVWQEPDLSGPLHVDDDGTVSHGLLGRVAAGGKTCNELAEELRASLERSYLRAPRVVVTLRESARRTASVLGPVERPGAHPVHEHMRVLDLLVAAGGLTPGAGSTAVLLHPTGAGQEVAAAPDGTSAASPAELDLQALLRGGDAASNPPVGPGDVLIVSRAATGAAAMAEGPTPRIRVVGEVARPGTYSLSQAPTILDAVLLAGGLTEYASGNRTRIVRGSGERRTETRVRLGDLMSGSGDAQNLDLKDGDLVVVPQSFF